MSTLQEFTEYVALLFPYVVLFTYVKLRNYSKFLYLCIGYKMWSTNPAFETNIYLYSACNKQTFILFSS